MFGRLSPKPSSESEPSLAGKPSSDGKPSDLSEVVTITLPINSHLAPTNIKENLDMKLRRGKVYVAMFALANPNHYHWALVMATNERSGMLYHNTNHGGPYAFRANYHNHLLNSSSLVAVVEISSITPLDRAIHQRLAERLKSIPIGSLTCQPWLWNAIRLAAEEGFLGIDADNDDIIGYLEEECITIASRGKPGHAVYAISRMYKE
ncbi:hypothetical protein GX50_02877 [[Emmonsia] crescens]|uniref:Uncharacterized protein n=1 Tax=[Emmonsia] crescens TaxID=73230 RepID=A0A2B7ZCW0_9EURO|nr:hypothetical protein GX50_02877 [Emmonsia crescens]